MIDDIALKICEEQIPDKLKRIKRCAIGYGNYVYIAECREKKYVLRCSEETNAYESTIHWLHVLEPLDIPAPGVIAQGKYEQYDYLILTYMKGQDIGVVYPQLTDTDKRRIAKDIVRIQNEVSGIDIKGIEKGWNWSTYVSDILHRAKERIEYNGYFDSKRVDTLLEEMSLVSDYFAGIKPVPYLDDISSKNILIDNGMISGIIDIDWMGVGDRLTFAALTNMAFLDLGYDTDYVKYILEEMQVDDAEKRAFLFYTLMYCVDFMGERGMRFMDKTIEVNGEIVNRLNRIYDDLIQKWYAE